MNSPLLHIQIMWHNDNYYCSECVHRQYLLTSPQVDVVTVCNCYPGDHLKCSDEFGLWMFTEYYQFLKAPISDCSKQQQKQQHHTLQNINKGVVPCLTGEVLAKSLSLYSVVTHTQKLLSSQLLTVSSIHILLCLPRLHVVSLAGRKFLQ